MQFLFQPHCVVCQKKAALNTHWCRSCLRELYRARKNGKASLLEYDGAPVRLLLEELRGERHRHALRFLGKIFRTHPIEKKFDVILTAPQRQMGTGLQSVAERLAKLTGARYLPKYFKKQGGHRQHGKSAVDRLNAPFFVQRSRAAPRLENLRVLVVDDVSTTGTTLGQCSVIAKEQGASLVEGLVLASRAAKIEGENQETKEKSQ
jgi:predicted amidophosphoribosyltransferase